MASKVEEPEHIALRRQIIARLTTGATQKRVAEEFGTDVETVRISGRSVEIYDEGLEILAREPGSIDALQRIGRLKGFRDVSVSELECYQVRTLHDLVKQEWSRAELLALDGFGAKRVSVLEAAMAEYGLSLHPDRAQPIIRERGPDAWEKAVADRIPAGPLPGYNVLRFPDGAASVPMTTRNQQIRQRLVNIYRDLDTLHELLTERFGKEQANKYEPLTTAYNANDAMWKRFQEMSLISKA